MRCAGVALHAERERSGPVREFGLGHRLGCAAPLLERERCWRAHDELVAHHDQERHRRVVHPDLLEQEHSCCWCPHDERRLPIPHDEAVAVTEDELTVSHDEAVAVHEDELAVSAQALAAVPQRAGDRPHVRLCASVDAGQLLAGVVVQEADDPRVRVVGLVGRLHLRGCRYCGQQQHRADQDAEPDDSPSVRQECSHGVLLVARCSMPFLAMRNQAGVWTEIIISKKSNLKNRPKAGFLIFLLKNFYTVAIIFLITGSRLNSESDMSIMSTFTSCPSFP